MAPRKRARTAANPSSSEPKVTLSGGEAHHSSLAVLLWRKEKLTDIAPSAPRASSSRRTGQRWPQALVVRASGRVCLVFHFFCSLLFGLWSLCLCVCLRIHEYAYCPSVHFFPSFRAAGASLPSLPALRMPPQEGCPAAAVIQLAHPSVLWAFASHEDMDGELTAIALPRALGLLHLPTDNNLAAVAAAGPPLNRVAFNELATSLFAERAQELRASISLQSALRGMASRAKKKKRKMKATGDLNASAIGSCVSGLGVSQESGALALLELRAPSLQLHALSGLHTFPALTSVDLSSNALTTLQPLAALPQVRHHLPHPV